MILKMLHDRVALEKELSGKSARLRQLQLKLNGYKEGKLPTENQAKRDLALYYDSLKPLKNQRTKLQEQNSVLTEKSKSLSREVAYLEKLYRAIRRELHGEQAPPDHT